MRKYWLVLLMLVVVLSACTPTATAMPTPEDTVTSVPPTVTVTSISAAPAASCEPFVLLDQVIPAADPRLPAVTAEDWARGPSEALVTFLDYSDFQ
jgi:hypothetical protein